MRRIDLPATCGHAGGVAVLKDGRIVVADTFSLYAIAGGKVVATVKLKGKLRGSFADSDGRSLWIGSYDRSGGTLWRLPPYDAPPAIDIFLLTNPDKAMNRAEKALLSGLQALIAETPFEERIYNG